MRSEVAWGGLKMEDSWGVGKDGGSKYGRKMVEGLGTKQARKLSEIESPL